MFATAKCDAPHTHRSVAISENANIWPNTGRLVVQMSDSQFEELLRSDSKFEAEEVDEAWAEINGWRRSSADGEQEPRRVGA